MSQPAEPQHEGALGALTDLGNKLIGALPPAFLMLVVMNACFLGMVLWFLNHQADQRTALVTKLVDRCMEIALHEQPSTPH
jgi:hypothetical protein